MDSPKYLSVGLFINRIYRGVVVEYRAFFGRTHLDNLCHTCKCVTHVYESCVVYEHESLFTCMNESCHIID